MITREDSFESVQSLPFPTGLAVNLGDGGGQNVQQMSVPPVIEVVNNLTDLIVHLCCFSTDYSGDIAGKDLLID